MNTGMRIDQMKEKITRAKVAREQYIESIEKAIYSLKEGISSIDEISRNIITTIDGRFLEETFLDSLRDMTFEELVEVRNSLRELIEHMLDIVERSL